MTFKQIETSREIRLWIAQIIVPAITAVAIAMSIPEVRYEVAEKVSSLKETIRNKFKR